MSNRRVGGRRLLRAALVALAGTVIAACGSSAGSRGRPASGTSNSPVFGGTLTVAIPAQPLNLDWSDNTTAVTIDIADNIYETLFATDQNDVLQPMLAKSQTTSANGQKVTIDLRQGVMFQNGQEMTSADVVASIKRWLAVSVGGASVSPYVVSVEGPSQFTVVINLNKPYRSLLSAMAALVEPCIIMPASIANAAGSSPLTNSQIVGTGPYKLSKVVSGQYIELTKFAGYTPLSGNATGGFAGKKTAYLTNLIFKIVPDATVRLQGLETGQWQFAEGIDLSSVQQAEANSSIRVYSEGQAQIEYLLINEAVPPFNNIGARRALNMAINKTDIALTALGPKNLWSPLTGSFALPSDKAMYSTAGNNVFTDYNPTKAKQLFAQAGVTPSTPITILTTKTYPEFYNSMVVVQSQLSALGLKVNMKVEDFPTMRAQLGNEPNTWNLSMTAFAGDPLDPTQILFLGKKYPGGYKSKQMDQLFSQYEAATTEAAAKQVVDQIQALVWKDLPDIAIGKLAIVDAASTSLHGYENYSTGTFWNTYLSK